MFAWGVRIELLDRNPAGNIDPPKIVQRESADLSKKTLTKILAAVEGTEFQVIAPFAILTGVRRGEIAALQWRDIDLKRGRYSIRRSAAILDGKQIIKPPKSPKSRRTEALTPTLVSLLQRHRREQAKRHDRIGLGLPSESTVVFDREDGSSWNVNELSRRWSRFVKGNDLPHLRWHDLRHAFATASYDSGEPLHSISAALGHSSLGITSSTYVHVLEDSERAARRTPRRLFRPAVL